MFFLFAVVSAFLAATALSSLCAGEQKYKKKLWVTDASKDSFQQKLPTKDSSNESAKQMHSAYVDFCLALFRSSCDSAKNCVLSPLSFGCTLMLLLEGSAGDTRAELQQLLGKGQSLQSIGAFYTAFIADLNFLALVSHGRLFTAHIANALFTNKGTAIDEAYTKLVRELYDGSVMSLNFGKRAAAAKLINAYVNERTHGLIPKVVKGAEIDDVTRGFIVSAIYFKGLWQMPFERTMTEQRLFRGLKGARKAHFMRNDYFSGKYAHSDELDAFQMHYKDPTYSLFALMPSGDFNEWLSSLDAAKICAVMDGMVGGSKIDETQETDDTIDLSFPRFDIATTIDGKAALRKLDVARCFAPGADLSRMCKEKGLAVDNCVQQAIIQVNEEGTIAAAATTYAVEFGMKEKLKIIFDRPFLFLLMRGRSPVFVGQVV